MPNNRMLATKEYREANRRIQKAVKKAKEDWIGAQCEEIETCLNKNNSKRAYQLVKDLTSEKQGRSSTIQDGGGRVVRWSWVNFQCRGVLQFGFSRARAYCACSRCGWGLFGHFLSHLSFLSSFSLSLGDGPI